jgi:hypothetical protein
MSTQSAERLLNEIVALLRHHEHESEITDLEIVGALTYALYHKMRCSFDAHGFDAEDDAEDAD